VRTTLADRLAARDRQHFIGRRRDLELLDSFLVEDPPVNVVLIHGPGGIGKSTLLRELGRRAQEYGRSPRLVDARELAPVPGEIEQALEGVDAEQLPLVMFDTYERMAAAGAYLRQRLLPSLPEQSVVILAGRNPPEPEWFQGGWEQVTIEHELRPLGEEDGRALLRERGVEDRETLEELLDWSGGSPLALTLGAEAVGAGGVWNPGRIEDRPELVRALIRHLASTELDGGNLDVIAVAALARATTQGMLEEVLPGVDAAAAEEWLRARSFAEETSSGVTLHDIVRKAVRADLKVREPERERDLRRRIADHLHARALRDGDPRLITDLAELVDNPTIRWGFGAEGTVEFRVDDVRHEDLEAASARLRERPDGAAWWELARPLVEDAPECVVMARDRDDNLAGICIFVTPRTAPAAAERDPILSRWLVHAREHYPDGKVMLWRDSLDLSESHSKLGSRVLAILNTAAILRSGLVNPRISYLPIDPSNEAAAKFASRVGAVHVPELDAMVGERRHECHILDHGPGGMLGAQLATVYWELGMHPPDLGAAAEAATGEAAGSAESNGVLPAADVTRDTVKALARALDRPLELAASPLARGTATEERAESVRALFREACSSAFGESADEQLLRQIAERGFLERDGASHEALAEALNVSRATYFRRLRQAADRLADAVLARVRVG
jgi:hypothetical protein